VDIPRALEEGIKVYIALGAAGLALVWRWLPRKLAVGLLAATVLFAGLNYARFGTRRLDSVDTYDLIHYYLNARYFEELGYYDLYPACMLADRENGGPRFAEGPKYMAQDETGDHLRSVSLAVVRGQEVKASFSPERWQAFSHDFLYLQREIPGMNDTLWRMLIQDHGFNGTTVWTALARPLARLVPVEAVKWLCWIDVGILLVAVGAVVWAFDGTAALWTALFLLVSYSTRWPSLSTAFLRYDYAAALIIATCALKRGRYMLAGLLGGYAATLRIFPVLWLGLPGIKGGLGLLRGKVDRKLLILAGGFLLGAAVLQGYATASLGPQAVRTHWENMQQHTSAEELSSRRIGLALALNYRGEVDPKNISHDMKEAIGRQEHLRYALGGISLLLLGFALRRSPDEEVFALGFVPFFLFTTASYYYYVVRAPLVAVHAGGRASPRHTVGLAMLFGMEALTHGIQTWWPDHRVMLIGWLAWGICLYIAVMTGWLLLRPPPERATS